MTVHFFEPPLERRAGGLDAAIRSIEIFLRQSGIRVSINPDPAELGKSANPEVAHFHGIWEPRFLRASARCRRIHVPYIVSPHGMLEPWERRHKCWKKTPWFHLFEHRHLSGATALLTTSQQESTNLRRVLAPEKCVALPLGLTSDRRPDYSTARQALGWSRSEIVLLFLSRIHPKKGLPLLLKSLAHAEKGDLKPVRLVIVGAGEESYVRKVKSLAERDREILPRIEWAGEVWGEAKWDFIQGADLLCLPSFSENFGLVVLEALQVGTPVLTTNRTPWQEVPTWGGALSSNQPKKPSDLR